MDSITVQTDDFNIADEYQALCGQNTETGAIVFFSGLVRDRNEGIDVTGLFLEHYPGMTERSLEDIVKQARLRWPILQVRLIHRVGQLDINDQIVFVGVSSAHREAAFDACRFIMDFLKTEAPFWKKETRTDGHHWIESQTKDQEAKTRWNK
ncbi:MAG: molybdopterin synthase catalytic subunit MoaE [Thalassolituus sp.]|uniref:molybdopterin synthase catalytic subunit MoaE n=1 Tax=Thalassolituus TaxID=187492 RepID=UPI00042DB72E|nr:molybdopterin synthase catalytic subunit MoaE [Thalassolituus oleivorans]AHK16985.1 molybdopterin guanine dinucleotide biosynthesis protein MoaE [Thalassolituus oleivorans R6-15]MCA6126797.1 molybdenum cofactor biosynthesis protein MoaE [Thalassolituus oleivorans 4BN06-13]|tara:strand:+ start:308 stop:763 length:456 start_codon:yes stop_codon:yes gene_type:complete